MSVDCRMSRSTIVTFGLFTLGSLALPARAAGDVLATSSAASAAETTDAGPVPHCSDTRRLGQELRQDGRLLESRALLLRCSQEDCPRLVRKECKLILDELEAQVPSVVFRVTVNGERRSDVAAFIGDRQLFAEIPEGAVTLNPGRHRIRFQIGTLTPVEREIELAAGEHARPIAVAFDAPNYLSSEGSVGATNTPNAPIPWPVYGLAGVGVAGLGGFVGFGLATRSRESELRASCSPFCTSEQIDSVNQRAMIADISLGVGVAAFALAATVYLLLPSKAIRVGTAVLPSGALRTRVELAF